MDEIDLKMEIRFPWSSSMVSQGNTCFLHCLISLVPPNILSIMAADWQRPIWKCFWLGMMIIDNQDPRVKNLMISCSARSRWSPNVKELHCHHYRKHLCAGTHEGLHILNQVFITACEDCQKALWVIHSSAPLSSPQSVTLVFAPITWPCPKIHCLDNCQMSESDRGDFGTRDWNLV